MLRAKTKVLCYKKWKSVMNMEYILLKALRRARWGGSLALSRLLVSSGTTTLSPEETSFYAISSGQTGFSPEGMTFLSWKSLRCEQMVKRSPSNLFSSTPWRPTRLHQIHFGSAPATECVLWHIACQGGAEKVSPWQGTPLRVRSKPHCLPK